MFYYNIDLDTGKDITLKEWFGSNYKKIIADEVQKQINTWDDEKKFYLWEDLDLEDLDRMKIHSFISMTRIRLWYFLINMSWVQEQWERRNL